MFELDAALYWHGRLMVAAWAVLFPAGVLVARFYKITPRQDFPRERDNQAWWVSHLVCQYTGGVLVVLAIFLTVTSPSDLAQQSLNHRILGWTTVVLCALQFLGGWLRGTKGGPTDPKANGSLSGDHYSMTRRRRVFEALHKSNGYLALLLSVATILTGLASLNAPGWMYLTLAAWWVLLVGAFLVMQLRGMHHDTYAAIWGKPYTSTDKPQPRHE